MSVSDRPTAMRQRSVSQMMSSTFEPLTRPIQKHSRVASKTSDSSGICNRQIGGAIGAHAREEEGTTTTPGSHEYLNPADINRRAIQIFHTEGEGGDNREGKGGIIREFWRIIHP